jgi:hypothetical protein
VTRFGEANWACGQEETCDASATFPRAVLKRAILTVSRRGCPRGYISLDMRGHGWARTIRLCAADCGEYRQAADISACPEHVCFTPKSGHRNRPAYYLRRSQLRHARLFLESS